MSHRTALMQALDELALRVTTARLRAVLDGDLVLTSVSDALARAYEHGPTDADILDAIRAGRDDGLDPYLNADPEGS